MPTYESKGEENLRADPEVKAGPGDKTPSYKGKDAGGDSVGGVTVMSGGSKSTPAGDRSTPKGVQNFDGEAV